MRIAIVNRFMPPDESPTAVLAGELAEYLASRGHVVEKISSSGGYRKVTKGNRGLGRAAGELKSHASLLWKMLRTRNPDLIICLSSPTCLAVTAALVAMVRRTRLAHWAMDVYPELAAELGEIKRGGFIHGVTGALMNAAYRRTSPLVALDEDMQQLFAKKGFDAGVCRPWAPLGLKWPEKDPRAELANGERVTIRWVYSGNLGRAHEWEALLLAQQRLENTAPGRFKLVFQGGGASRKAARQRAVDLGLRDCEWTDYVPKEELLNSLFQADVLVATQNPVTKGMLWPSKLAVMKKVPRPILWVGPDTSAVADELRSRPLTATVPIDESAPERIAEWLQALPSNSRYPYAPPHPSEGQEAIKALEEILIPS